MKKLLFLSLTITSLFFLSACGGQSVKIKDDYISLSCLVDRGGVVMGVEFGFDEERLNGYPQGEVCLFKDNLKGGIENIRSEFLLTLALKYTQNPIQEFAINRGVTLSQVGFRENSVGFTIKYNSLSAWNYYNSSNDDKGESKEGFYLIKKVASEGNFPFASILSNGKTMGEKYKNVYISALKDLSFEDQEKGAFVPTFVYDYATFSPHLKSNANQKVSAKLYHHIWIYDDVSGAKIQLWQYKINHGMWMLFAILFTIPPCLIYVSIQIYREKHPLKR